MKEEMMLPIVAAVAVIGSFSLAAFIIWTDHQENMAKIQAGQKVEQTK